MSWNRGSNRTATVRLWLFKADQNYGIITNQYKALDCKTNGFLTSVENTVKPIWKSGYITYKRAAASASCYVNDSLERLKLPFSHLSEWLSLKFSDFFDGHFSFLSGVTNTLWQGLRNIFKVFRNAFSNLSLFLFEFFTDLISAVTGVLDLIYRFFKDVCFKIVYGFAGVVADAFQILKSIVLNVGSFVYLLMFAPTESARKPEPSGEVCFKKEDVDKLSSGAEDFNSISWDLSDVKKKIGQLEQEFRLEKESIKSRNQFYDKQLENNYLILQKYQATVNHALTSTKRPMHLTSSSIQYFLDNHSDSLKQWILRNFMLKADSMSIDENKIALLIAKESNRSGEELLMLKQEFKKFILNHKKELEMLRSDFSSLVNTNLNGDISVGYIKKLVGDAIKLYDADKTGRADYALETAGGQVLSIRCTETYIASPKSYILLGWAVYTKTSSPRDAINPGMAAGQCWAFAGSQGFLVLQLSHAIQVTGFSMEHISKSLVPIGHIESAPKNFSMWGLKSEYDVNPYLFGEYSYLDNDETLQYFPVAYPTSVRFNIVELKITSNHGNLNYTCLYRIRVHGDLNPV